MSFSKQSTNVGFFQGQTQETSDFQRETPPTVDDAEIMDKEVKKIDDRVEKIESMKKATGSVEDYTEARGYLHTVRTALNEVKKQKAVKEVKEHEHTETTGPRLR
jgi:hypothetical protein